MDQMLQQPLIINLAPTGAVADPRKNPNVPVSIEQIVSDVESAAHAGASIAHLHVRDKAAAPSCDPNLFAALLERLRSTPATREMVLCATTSGRHGQTLEQRAAVLELSRRIRPDMASLTLGSLNFPSGPSINSPDTIRRLADRMNETGVKPELEVFDLGMIEFAKTLIAEGRLNPPFYFNIILGNVGSLACSLPQLGIALSLLPQPAIVSVGGIGRAQATANALGVVAAHGVRVGLEDNLWAEWGTRTPASNLGLVQDIVEIARSLKRPIATPVDTRRLLGITS